MLDYFYFCRDGQVVIRGRDLGVESVWEIISLLRGESVDD